MHLTLCPLSLLERKITDVPTRLKHVSNDINVFNCHDRESDQPTSLIIFVSSVVRCSFQR